MIGSILGRLFTILYVWIAKVGCRANTYRHTTYITDIPYSHTHINT